jgi:hypothetical protein
MRGSRIVVGVSAERVVVAAAVVVRDDVLVCGGHVEGEVAEREAQAVEPVAADRRDLTGRGLQFEATLDPPRRAEPHAAAAPELPASRSTSAQWAI